MFKPKAFALAAVALLVTAAPVNAAKPDAPSEVTLHIEADAAIPPDRAEMNLSITGSGVTRAAAINDLKAKQAKLTAALGVMGIGGAQIKSLEPAEDKDAANEIRARTEVIDVAAASDKASRRSAEPPLVAVSAIMRVTVDDLTKLADLQTAARANDVETYRLNYGGRFYSSDPVAARKRAREQAIAKARTEAAAMAAAMGYHVVRLTRVSNTSPPLNMHDLHTAIGYADGARETLQPGYFASAAYATVSLDFVIAPN